jgi:DNA-binding response OmpR family regulator
MASERPATSPPFSSIVKARTRIAHVPPRILVADDDDEMRLLLVDALGKDGYEVIEAADGGGLLVSLSAQYRDPESIVDLVISDIRMPIYSGLRILEALRRANWTVPVILMTAFGDDETRAQAESLGAFLFDKPFAIDDLRTAILNLLPPK